MVQLPLRVYASGQGPSRSFDLSNEAERIELYEIVLTDGTAEDVCHYVNREELLRLWAPAMAAATRTTGVAASAWCGHLVSLDPLHEQIAPIAFALPPRLPWPEAARCSPIIWWIDQRSVTI
jgi:hypothetical protein